ncbi:helicase-related protein [Sorangium sp. So ce693]|uniref:helicase-related protein n=1 Tax=Sorangium sp. So ce693 TaxID=3133318 RepID=UPI003F629CC1
MKLEQLQKGARVWGLAVDGIATVRSIEFHGSNTAELIFADARGALHTRIVSRDDEPSLELVEGTRPWSFDADGNLFRLVSEARRIELAWLFDPYVAITSSTIEPLPHQISAVYEEMLPRQPMRFLLADDPGAGKTIMAGLLIKELMIRGDLERCLIISPGSLTEQWQDELAEKFSLEFEILTRDMIAAARTANPFESKNLLIARLDQLSRNVDVKERLKVAPEWDLVVCDEAHRMSGHVFGDEIKYTKRYQLGEVVGQHTRNLLLMTATPHNGNDEDFHIFLALLDGDRFAGRFREGEHTGDPSDLMRRLVKEDLLRFDGSKLFPERKSYTAQYELSSEEAHLYAEVTEYVRTEMNRAERFGDKEASRKVNIGFALMTLQRRLASSPEAIFRSIQRRRERLEARLRDEKLVLRGKKAGGLLSGDGGPQLNEEDIDELYDEAPQDEREDVEQKVIDHATAARTVEELQAEIVRLKDLEQLAKNAHSSGEDTKWQELSRILDDPLMLDEQGHRRKLVVFTEFKDTLMYLARRIRTRLGRPEAVVEIHGGVTRDDRRRVVEAFMNDPTVLVLVANDAAGEGVNLQRAHLMVNYDLPWNPNRLEQRFGRIHRIGQREVCHLWNLVAKETREGDVYIRLLTKLEAERDALGGKVFDVLGQLFDKKPLRELLMEAIRYGADPARKAELLRQTDGAVDHQHILTVMERRALVLNEMDISKVMSIREDMERAYARRLQPHFIQSLFAEAFRRLGGTMHRREEGRFEITHVPVKIRERDRLVGTGAPVQARYERVTFDKKHVDEQPRAHLICPGSPLLEATISCTLDEHVDVLKRGTVLVDDADGGVVPRLLFTLEHAVQDGRKGRHGTYNVVSQRLEFVEAMPDGIFRHAGAAPYLDYRGASEAERTALASEIETAWLKQDWEALVMSFAIQNIAPRHLEDVKRHRLPLIAKVEAEVKSRLMKEIRFWDARSEELRVKERAGKKTKLPAQVAEERANRLGDRLKTRMAQLQAERAFMVQPPLLKGGALVVPRGLLAKLGIGGGPAKPIETDADRELTERLAMEAVMAAERALGREPRDVHLEPGLGYDIESKDLRTGNLFFIEVKGRLAGSEDVCLQRSQILCALNAPDRFRLAVVLIENGVARSPLYVTHFDFGQPGFAQTNATYALSQILAAGGPPR